MKRIFCRTMALLAILISCTLIGKAQEIGIRGGDLSGGNIAITGAFSTGYFTRIHTCVSFGESVGVDLLWDFIHRPLIDEVLYVYAGAGSYALFEKPFVMGTTGEIGMEYRFDSVPVVLGLDWRPTYKIINETEFSPEGFGFNIRFVLDYY